MIRLSFEAHCLNSDCDWTGDTDAVAEKHSKAAGHPTSTQQEAAK